MLGVEGQRFHTFVDKGSQVTLMEKEAVGRLSPPARGLRGVSGKELVTEEMDVEFWLRPGRSLLS